MRRQVSLPEFHALLKAQDVPTREDLAFKCPLCKTVQSIGDLLDAGVKPEEIEKRIGFSCVGRFNGAGPATKEGTPQPGKFGCDWTLGGLFQLHDLEVIGEDGVAHPCFVPCDASEAQEHALARAARRTLAVAGAA